MKWFWLTMLLLVLVGGGGATYAIIHNRNVKQAQKIAEQQRVAEESAERARTNTISQQVQCLGTAYQDYKKAWDAADTDKDGKVAYTDGWLGIQTNYYDAEITCYQVWKTDDNTSKIADLQQKRQQDTDTYNAWLSSLRQTVPQSTHCTSSTITGRYVYTDCY